MDVEILYPPGSKVWVELTVKSVGVSTEGVTYALSFTGLPFDMVTVPAQAVHRAANGTRFSPALQNGA